MLTSRVANIPANRPPVGRFMLNGCLSRKKELQSQFAAEWRTLMQPTQPSASQIMERIMSQTSQPNSGDPQMYEQLGKMTRSLHDTLRALGHDKTIEKTAEAIPDARERLAYVLIMTEQAASRVLNAVDAISPLQDSNQAEARDLQQAWERVADGRKDSKDYRDTVLRTRQFLQQVDANSETSKTQLMEIMMSQEFQDLTGQVIKKIVDLAQEMENQLLSLLSVSASASGHSAGNSEYKDSLMNGPAMASDKHQKQAVSSQAEVDSFLENLGF